MSGTSKVSPLRVRHSWSPCRLQTLSGCWQGRAQFAVKSEIGTVDRLGFGNPSLLHQKGSQSMPGRLHPGPWFVVLEIVVEFDGTPEMGKRRIVIPLAVFEFAQKHLLGHLKDTEAGIVEQFAGLRNPVARFQEMDPFSFRFRDPAGRGKGHRTGIVDRGRRDAIELLIVGQGLFQNVLPASEPDQHMLLDGNVALQPVGKTVGRLTQEARLAGSRPFPRQPRSRGGTGPGTSRHRP